MNQAAIPLIDSPCLAHQGHPYLFDGRKVIALETSQTPKVLFITTDVYSWETKLVDARYLIPQPSRYLHGQIAS